MLKQEKNKTKKGVAVSPTFIPASDSPKLLTDGTVPLLYEEYFPVFKATKEHVKSPWEFLHFIKKNKELKPYPDMYGCLLLDAENNVIAGDYISRGVVPDLGSLIRFVTYTKARNVILYILRGNSLLCQPKPFDTKIILAANDALKWMDCKVADYILYIDDNQPPFSFRLTGYMPDELLSPRS